MPTENFFTYHPDRIVWCGLAILGALAGSLTPIAYFSTTETLARSSEIKKVKSVEEDSEPFDFSLSFDDSVQWGPLIPDIRNQAVFSFDPPRPDGTNQQVQLSVRLKQAAEYRSCSVPCRINLEYRNGILSFAENESLFWLELKEGLIGTVFVDGRPGDPFSVIPQESPLQTAQEFREGTPFRILAEGRWWGPDLFRQLYQNGKTVHRIEVGALTFSELLDVGEEEWLAFKGGRWEKISALNEAEGMPVARIKSATPSALEIEGWEGNRHVRISLGASLNCPFKVKAEELFSSIRVRSDKQISCILDKQCLILRIGDWVLKMGNRWKVLRREEEKEAFLSGKIAGELFVLDHISNLQGQKAISGHIYNLSRTQSAPIDLPVLGKKSLSARGKELMDQRGGGKAR